MDQETPATLIGFPFDENSSFMRGAAEASPLIRQALFSDSSNLWTEQGIDLGADIVEFNPRCDLNGMTAMVCAKIVKELAAVMLVKRAVPLGGHTSGVTNRTWAVQAIVLDLLNRSCLMESNRPGGANRAYHL
jgi:arginase family enzyme